MKLLKKMAPVATATTLAISAMALPSAASAELTANLGIANMYLWRGQNVSPNGGQVHGTLQYDVSGFYVGLWTTSEDGGHETDLYLGYGGEVGLFKYDVSYWNYLYPEDTDSAGSGDLADTNQEEVAVSLGVGPVSLGIYVNVDSDTPDDNYFTLSGEYKNMSLTYGMWDLENGSVPGASDEYSHLTFTFAATDALSFSVSKAFSDLDEGDAAAVEEDPLFQVAYGWDFKL